MLGAYASFLVCLVAAAIVGQAIMIASGRKTWSRLAPAVGIAALCPLAWWTVRLPGEGLAALLAIALATAASAYFVVTRVEGFRTALRRGIGVEIIALALASLPFFVEGRFGILGTGLNPDMSQHLFALDRLAAGGTERLISEGYPLGPHSIVAALTELGPSTVQAFDGLSLFVAVAACLAPLALLDQLSAWRRIGGALCVGFAYLVAAYLVQGAFKETMQALFVLAFAIALGRLAQPWPTRAGGAGRPLRALPLAVLAIGSVYVYSFPGLLWLGGALAIWAAIELVRAARREGLAKARAMVRLALPTALVATGVLVAVITPELGRIVNFAGFETFNPSGDGLGNLFDRLSPLQALGIWPSGDFRVEPGDGSVPAIVFYLGSAFGLAALGFGLIWWWRQGERTVPAALAAAALLWLYTLLAGTPYQEAKALVLAAPLVALISVRALAASGPALVTAAFFLAAGGSSVLALANGPVGPAAYTPELAEARPDLGSGSTLVIAPETLLRSEHGRDYLLWELRGNRICIEVAGEGGDEPLAGISNVIAVGRGDAVEPEALYIGEPAVDGPCALIADGARADPAGDG